VAGFSIAAFALAATTACGKEKEAQSDVVSASTSVSPNVDSGTVALTVPVNVTYAEVESVYNERRYAEATAMFAAVIRGA
jgi:hypothetical protein